MSKRGLPLGLQMRHDSHYVDELSTASRSIGRKIPIDLIEPNPEQPRVEFGDLSELTASIKEKGVLEPLLVKRDGTGRKWMIIAGERRWRASRQAGLTELPCIEMELDEQGIAEIALIENLQRKDLTVWEEADGLKYLADKFGYKHDEIAQKISKSRSTVTELMSIAGIPEHIRIRCREAGANSKAALLEVARQFDEAAMLEFVENLRSGKKPKREKAAKVARDQVGSTEKTPAGSRAGAFSYQSSDHACRIELSFDGERDLTASSIAALLRSISDEIESGETTGN